MPSAAGLGALVLPAAAIAGPPIDAPAGAVIAAGVVAVAAWVAVSMLAGGSRGQAGLGVLLLAAAASLAGWASYPWAGYVVALAAGGAIGLCLPARSVRRPGAPAVAVAGSAVVAAHVIGGLAAGTGTSVAFLLVSAIASPAAAQARSARRPPTLLGPAGVIGLTAIAVCWVGATSPRVEWFGDLTYHGPRDGGLVAITFDDGPNGASTLAVAQVLEDHGARGTFFLVGKAVEREPDVALTLARHGHLIGNHSYSHGAVSFLNPRYPELAQTQALVFAETGLCPRFFRPPHGTHTPFMSLVSRRHGMRLVTWDVSAADWVDEDSTHIAQRIVEQAHGGSIILLHDGLDGRADVDRSVVVRALPLILDGLAAKGLRPVLLDQLLGGPGYLPAEQCAS